MVVSLGNGSLLVKFLTGTDCSSGADIVDCYDHARGTSRWKILTYKTFVAYYYHVYLL